MPDMLVCVSHSPIIIMREKPPAEEPAILDVYQRASDEISAFDPELVVIFGTDHYAGFHLDLMPPYCIGFAAKTLGDVGGFAGELDVPRDVAVALVESLYQQGFDPAVSHDMRIDHGFSQPLHRLLGGVGARPVVPVFINVMSAPIPSFKRSRQLGGAAGLALRDSGKRVLWIGSGGLSHHPARYYPSPDDAPEDVADWQRHGPASTRVSPEQWFERLHEMHVEGARMLADGRRTPREIHLNPEFDRQFMQLMERGDVSSVDAWDAGAIRRTAGMGSLELQAWVAAMQAYGATNETMPHLSYYAPTLEYGGGYGMVVAGGLRP